VTETVIETIRHGKIDLALHHLRDAGEPAIEGTEIRPLLLLHGLGEASPTSVPPWAAAWPGAIAALDFTGHGASTVPHGGGYTAELLLADADAALAALTGAGSTGVTPTGVPHTGITVLGRGLGAYIALQLAGARASRVHGAILVDGPGLAGGPTGPTSQSFFSLPSTDASPDPYALVELGRDLRPPDYATSFVRLALAESAFDEPIAVSSVFRPEWLDAVAKEHGVMDVPLAEALTAYSS
jgi:pimeloyl-ACP methyl ester carboxylesterase